MSTTTVISIYYKTIYTMTLILIILLCNTALFIALLINTATIAKRNEKQLNIIKADNQAWKYEVRQYFHKINICNEIIDKWIVSLQDLLHKNK